MRISSEKKKLGYLDLIGELAWQTLSQRGQKQYKKRKKTVREICSKRKK